MNRKSNKTREAAKTMLWRGMGSAAHVTLLGSIHALFDNPPEWALEPARSHDQIVLEADAASFSPEAMERPNGATITGSWPGLYSAFKSATIVADIDTDQLDRAWPAWAAIVLPMRTLRDLLPCGIEAKVSTIRDERGLSPRFLEDYADFRNLITNIPLQEQASFLRRVIQDLKLGRKKLARAEIAWRRGQLSALAAALDLTALLSHHPEVFASLFELRHQLWLPKLEAYIRESAAAEQRLLVVVGAGHLWGPSSLLAYLRLRGFTFENEP
jgi:uncharacterized protein YbaP (TraB family)